MPLAMTVPLPRLASVAGMDVDLPRMGVSTSIGARDDLTHAIRRWRLGVRRPEDPNPAVGHRHLLGAPPRRSREPPTSRELWGASDSDDPVNRLNRGRVVATVVKANLNAQGRADLVVIRQVQGALVDGQAGLGVLDPDRPAPLP